MPPRTNIKKLFGNWLNVIDKKTKTKIRVGVYALVWAIWNYKNDFLNKARNAQLLQVLHRVTH
jgi:hypothetical protein